MRGAVFAMLAVLLAGCGSAGDTVAPAQQTDEELLDLVNAGRIPATLVDDYIYDARRSQLEKTSVNRDVAVSQDGEIAWVTRKDAPRLLAVLNDFFSTHRLTVP